MPVSPDASGAELRDAIGTLLDQTGPRPSCSEAERTLGRLLAERWQHFTGDVRFEAFSCHPGAFLGFMVPVSLLTLVAVGCLLAGLPGWAGLLGGTAAVVTIAELLLYIELVDPLFPKEVGINVAAHLPPTGEVRQRILLTAHQDSAWEFNLWWWFKQWGVLVNVLGLAACLIPAVVGPLAWLGLVGGGVVWWAGVVGLVLAPLTALHVVFTTHNAVPGAMDDLAGLVTLEGVLASLSKARLQHTEVVLVACSSEECGLRGAKRYADAHRADHAAVPTLDINVDGVYDERFFTVITRELTTGVAHDPELIALAESLAEARGRPLKRAIVPFGATDATAFAHAGLRTVAFLCQDTQKLADNYHTRLDTLDRVRPESLEVMRDLVVDLCRALDAQSGGDAR